MQSHEVHVRRIKAEEVITEKDAKDNFVFPVASGELSQPYGTSRSFRRFQKNLISSEDSADDLEDEILIRAQSMKWHREAAAEEDEVLPDKGDSEDVLDRDPVEKTEDEKDDEDFWSLNGTCLTRHHRVPRTKLFSLYDVVKKKPPIPLEYVDIRRETYTNLESPEERMIFDTWWLPADQVKQIEALRNQERELSSPWTGKTMFNLLMNVPKPGFEWCEGEEIRVVHETTRPRNISPYNWSQLSRAQRLKRKKQWEQLQILEKPLRDIRKRNVIPPEEAEKYNMILSDQIAKTQRPACPAMPCIARPSSSSSSLSLSTTSTNGTEESDAQSGSKRNARLRPAIR